MSVYVAIILVLGLLVVSLLTTAFMVRYRRMSQRQLLREEQLAERARHSEERFRSLLRNAAETIAVLQADGTLRYVSPAIKRILGYEPKEVVGKNALEFVDPGDGRWALRTFVEAQDPEGLGPLIRLRLRHRDGTWIRLQVLYKNFLDNPDVRGILVRIEKGTERKGVGETLRRGEEHFRLVIENTSAILGLSEPDGTIRYVSPSVEQVLGYTPEEVANKGWLAYIHPEDVDHMRNALREARRSRGLGPSVEVRSRHKDGAWRYLEVSSTGVHDEAGVQTIVNSFRDITERRELEESLRHRAFHDLLTDLPNRQLFVDRLGQALRRTSRREGRRVAVLFMDLDNFKVINDSLGHQFGDRLLLAVAGRLRSDLRPEDTLARFGGDEFTVLIEDVERVGDAVKVAERIVEVFERPFVLDGRELFVRPSIGIALGTSRSLPNDLLRDADTAMYRAKEEDASYRVFDVDMHQHAVRRLELENELREAIEQDEFVIYYQPIVDIKTDKTRGFEALLRWKHPERGLLDPSQFVPVAEESDLILPLCEKVLRWACRRAKQWQEVHPLTPPLGISVNISARQLRRPELVEIIEGALNRSGLEAGRLSLDVTEAIYLSTLEDNTSTLDRLRALGVCISIDDFGTGYSTLSDLKRLSADTLKIDTGFVKGIGEDVGDTGIVQMVIGLAHTLGMEVIAEGVESENQAEQLKEMGCDLAQGFYFSDPLPAEAVQEYLAR